MKVTFDSNVWESLVVELSEYPAIRQRILSGAISPYMTEISVSLESIQKSARQRFFENYSPSFTWRAESVAAAGIHGTFSVGPDTASHPGLASKLLQKLLKAQELGFKVIRMTNFGTVRSPKIPKDMLLT